MIFETLSLHTPFKYYWVHICSLRNFGYTHFLRYLSEDNIVSMQSPVKIFHWYAYVINVVLLTGFSCSVKFTITYVIKKYIVHFIK